jgi:hypothetical protein
MNQRKTDATSNKDAQETWVCGKAGELWTPEHDAIARAEGWGLFNDGTRLSVQRIDEWYGPTGEEELPRWAFEDDRSAFEHVIQRAMSGSPVHAVAFYLDGLGVGQEVVLPACVERVRPAEPEFKSLPEHAKLRLVRPFSEKVNSFLEWCDELDLVLVNRRTGDETPRSRRDLLAEFFGIDLEVLEAEKVAMLDQLRAAHVAREKQKEGGGTCESV